MTTYVCNISGRTPILMHRFDEQNEVDEAARKIHVMSTDPRERAEKCAYRDPDGALYLPGSAIARMLREAGGSYKQRGSRKSLKFVVPAAILVVEDHITLRDIDGNALTDFEVDGRPVTIPATKGRIMRYRPRLNNWGCEFSLEIDETLMEATLVHQLIVDGGQKIGLLDYRPEKGGPFGRFQVVRWAEMGAKVTPVTRLPKSKAA